MKVLVDEAMSCDEFRQTVVVGQKVTTHIYTLFVRILVSFPKVVRDCLVDILFVFVLLFAYSHSRYSLLFRLLFLPTHPYCHTYDIQ